MATKIINVFSCRDNTHEHIDKVKEVKFIYSHESRLSDFQESAAQPRRTIFILFISVYRIQIKRNRNKFF